MTPRSPLLLASLLLTACPSEVAPSADQPPSAAKPEPRPEPAAPEPAPEANKAVEADPDRTKLAAVSSGVPLSPRSLLGKKPAEVEAELGEPMGKGMMRDSCVRFLPERTWFECDYAWQRYADKSGNYVAIQVGYEDGLSTSVAYEGVTADGDFDPRKALATIGVSLPGEPTQSEPAKNTKLWSWFNADARLLLDKKQYRVEVSTRDDKWEHSKVEIILNHPLTEAQKAKVKRPG